MSRHSRALLAAAAITCGCAVAACGAVRRPDGGVGLLPVGALAPDVAGRDPSGKVIHLVDVRGQPAVVYFYPKDETSGCTKEACGFRDAAARYSAAHVTVFGVSRDSQASHDEFAKHHELPFPLVADPDGSVSRAYGVGATLGMDSRVSFLVGADGKVVRVWPDVNPAMHADEVLSATRAVGAR